MIDDDNLCNALEREERREELARDLEDALHLLSRMPYRHGPDEAAGREGRGERQAERGEGRGRKRERGGRGVKIIEHRREMGSGRVSLSIKERSHKALQKFSL